MKTEQKLAILSEKCGNVDKLWKQNEILWNGSGKFIMETEIETKQHFLVEC
jgi:hypothetical protein